MKGYRRLNVDLSALLPPGLPSDILVESAIVRRGGTSVELLLSSANLTPTALADPIPFLRPTAGPRLS